MNDRDLERIPPEVLSLVRQEKAAMVDPGVARERLAARLAGSLALVPPVRPVAAEAVTTPAAAKFSWLPIVRALGCIGLGVGIGFGIGVRRAPHRVESLSLAPPDVRTVREVVTVYLPAPNVPSATAPASPPPLASHAPPSQPDPPHDGDLARERQLIEQGRTALAHGDTAASLQAFDQHARAFPRGQLVELREALAIQALARAGRTTEAAARRRAFAKAFPGSVYSAMVEPATADP